MKRPWSLDLMFRSAPSGARPRYRFITDQYGRRDLMAVACDDWSDPECHIWVYIQTGQAARASRAADAAEDWAARAEACCFAAMAARRLALATAVADADTAAVERVAAAIREAYAASEKALREAAEAHDAALAAAITCDVDRAADLADDASAAAKRAEEAARAAAAACNAAKAAAVDAVVDAGEVSKACDAAWCVAYGAAIRDFGHNRKQRAPRWHPTGYGAGRFGGDPRRAIKELAAEYMGVRV